MRRRHASVRRRLALVVVAGAVVSFLIMATQPRTVVALLARCAPGVVFRVETSQPLVALTFDDGPDPVYTPQVLDILERRKAPATFFLIGGHARRSPDLVERIRRSGHEIGNHMLTRVNAFWQPLDEFDRSVRTAEALLGLGAAKPRFFRPGGGLIRPSQVQLVRERGYVCVLGSAYPYDVRNPPVRYMRWLVGKNLEPGAIVVLHDSSGDRSQTVAALEGIIDVAEAKGLRFVTLSTLWSARDLRALRGLT